MDMDLFLSLAMSLSLKLARRLSLPLSPSLFTLPLLYAPSLSRSLARALVLSLSLTTFRPRPVSLHLRLFFAFTRHLPLSRTFLSFSGLAGPRAAGKTVADLVRTQKKSALQGIETACTGIISTS